MNFDVRPYIEYWNAKNRQERKTLVRRREEGLLEARRLAQTLRAEALVEKVVLFGSLAEGELANANFDIDLAIQGGDTQKAFRLAVSDVFRVDLVEYKELPLHVRLRIDAKGLTL